MSPPTRLQRFTVLPDLVREWRTHALQCCGITCGAAVGRAMLLHELVRRALPQNSAGDAAEHAANCPSTGEIWRSLKDWQEGRPQGPARPATIPVPKEHSECGHLLSPDDRFMYVDPSELAGGLTSLLRDNTGVDGRPNLPGDEPGRWAFALNTFNDRASAIYETVRSIVIYGRPVALLAVHKMHWVVAHAVEGVVKPGPRRLQPIFFVCFDPYSGDDSVVNVSSPRPGFCMVQDEDWGVELPLGVAPIVRSTTSSFRPVRRMNVKPPKPVEELAILPRRRDGAQPPQPVRFETATAGPLRAHWRRLDRYFEEHPFPELLAYPVEDEIEQADYYLMPLFVRSDGGTLRSSASVLLRECTGPAFAALLLKKPEGGLRRFVVAEWHPVRRAEEERAALAMLGRLKTSPGVEG